MMIRVVLCACVCMWSQMYVWPDISENGTEKIGWFSFKWLSGLFTRSYTYSPGKDTFTLEITRRGDRVRVWREILDRNDGSFIARYRFYESLSDILIEVKHNGRHVAKSPYLIKGLKYFLGVFGAWPVMLIFQWSFWCLASYVDISVEKLFSFCSNNHD